VHLSRDDLKRFAIERKVVAFDRESMRFWSLCKSTSAKQKNGQ